MPTRSQLTYGVRDSRDACGDGGEKFYEIVSSLARRGWSDAAIREEVAAVPRTFAPPPDWDASRMQQEIEIGIARVRPLDPKPVAVKKVEQRSVDGLPRWLRDRIESTAIPEDADRDQNFRDIVAELAARGWDSSRVEIEIYGKPWVPTRYAGRHLREWGIVPVIMVTPLRKIDDAAPDDARSSIDEAAPDGLRPPATVTSASRWPMTPRAPSNPRTPSRTTKPKGTMLNASDL